MHLVQLFETFFNFCCGMAFNTFVTFLGYIFVPLRQALFLETAKSHSESNQENRMVVPFQ